MAGRPRRAIEVKKKSFRVLLRTHQLVEDRRGIENLAAEQLDQDLVDPPRERERRVAVAKRRRFPAARGHKNNGSTAAKAPHRRCPP